MATPTSSATSPSPPMPYLSHGSITDQPSPGSPLDPHERENRKKAVQKFLARAEISMVTRALRARLSYASYKAIHNVSHVPLRELEGQLLSQTQAASFNRTIAAKRKSTGTSTSHYSNTSIPPSSATGAGAAARRGTSVNMPPPTSASSPRAHHSTVSGPSTTAANRSSAASSRGSANGQTLYTSILAPPTPAARTVHNANDPPLPPPSRPAPSPRVRTVKPSPKSGADGSRTNSKAKQPDKKNVASPGRRKTKRASLEKGKGKQRSRDLDADGDVDMKAAATLTSLLLNHRSSMHGSASSPRSSIDGSETGSTYSYSHFAQSSARSTTAASPPGSISSVTTMTGEQPYRQQTPPPGPSVPAQQTTPRPAPTDNEAADLMLFLATSPSPARPTPQPRDPSTYRTLGSDSTALRSKGRILFPSSSAPDVMVHVDTQAVNSREPPTLARTSDGTYALSMGSDMGSRHTGDLHASRILSSSVTPAQLLPPPPLPPSSRILDSPMRKGAAQSPKTVYGSGGTSADFNFNEFINASPSPSRGPPTHKPNVSLRADVGRKLFEEEQLRHSINLSQSPGKRHDGRSLGAGIDIVHT
ncbi:hypothetical protein P691DRAFT_672726 [Macrolepiota fuliginosa MF-IS2]|uniref:Uncharacterized protein n=1 Tax=Macrolepiota fuliginosa MF-IS2 TaxID=1400762 RepID=A0A9P5XB85_9AGAR|nr:hypothetical protein P691DRAFT_672726 [Macrolepiota fuliginosa MF-IS2]